MIRRAKKSDIEQIAQMESQYIQCAWTKEMLLEAFANSSYVFYVDEEDSQTIGYIFFRIVIDEAEICNIAVEKKFQQQGRATRLIAAAEEHCRKNKIGIMFLEVNEGNLAAKALYEKSGYNNLSVRKNYYSDGGAANVMKKLI